MTLQDWINKYSSMDELEFLRLFILAIKEDEF